MFGQRMSLPPATTDTASKFFDDPSISKSKTIQNQKNVLLNIKSFLKKHDTSEMDPQERRRHE